MQDEGLTRPMRERQMRSLPGPGFSTTPPRSAIAHSSIAIDPQGGSQSGGHIGPRTGPCAWPATEDRSPYHPANPPSPVGRFLPHWSKSNRNSPQLPYSLKTWTTLSCAQRGEAIFPHWMESIPRRRGFPHGAEPRVKSEEGEFFLPGRNRTAPREAPRSWIQGGRRNENNQIFCKYR